jgi:acyl-CoA reductase-like NAD-dependent aldehyde dehydrogenase
LNDTRDRLVRKGDYVWGSFIRPERIDGFINGVNPGDRTDVLGRFAFSEASVDEAVDYARTAARSWGRMPLAERAQAVRRFRQAVAKGRDRLVSLITRETGKPIWESRTEVIETLKTLDVLLDGGLRALTPALLEDTPGRSDRLPRGVVALVCPYNQPALIAGTYSAAALLGGNTVVYKPSKFTPGVGQLIAELWDQCRLPRGVLNMVQGSGAGVGKRLATHADIDALIVTGGFSTAMEIRRAVFDRPDLPVIYESGGKGIALVLDGCDLDRAVYEVMTGAFMGSGQRHDSTARVIVERGASEAFLERLVEKSRRLKVGYGFDDEVFMGPVISENARSRYRRYLRALAQKGHETLLEGQSLTDLDHRGFYVSPAIVKVDWRAGSAFMNEETPGPVLLVYEAADIGEALALHNQAYYRLSTSIFPAPDDDLGEIAARLRTGRLLVNRSTTTRALTLPASSLGRCGSGVPSGPGLVHALTYARAQMVETRPFDPTYTLPGVHWADQPATPEVLPPVDPADVSAMLEPT